MEKRRWFLHIWIGLLTSLFILHFAVTAFYLTPDNALKTKWWKPLNQYMEPLFSQNWKLFAPNPVSQNKDLWVKVRIVTPEGKTKETGWKNITRPLFKKKQAERLSSEGRVIRYLHAGMRSFENKDTTEQKKGVWMLRRAASTAITNLYPNKKVRAIKIRIVTNTFPELKKRHQPDRSGPLHFKDTKWLDFSPTPSPVAKEWPS
ncbi:hypothetical protein SAMN05444487_10665 [Marininema mesophilum]|uniref:Uncharacterized protein n=1 Tax=Marininema mesophilum TaxID=1048340 RepID=A0A1H2WA29_9BACL|nr:DUF5819 family protein [Marininema mesophilum]SDW77482.1 hypothetical protein SAMN05444487_10665 [Marininema mesophilum]